MSELVNRFIDLRSDTVTKPSCAMREAMFTAEVGDDVMCEDPTIIKLETVMTELFNKEAALFFPTGTMSNLAAVMCWCGTRGSEVILGESSHIFVYEQGGIAQIAGVLPKTIPNEVDGSLNIEAVKGAIRGDNVHYPVTELICIENTQNYCGGKVLSLEYMDALYAMARSKNIPVHMDGARIWNAAEALNCSLARATAGADSVSVCLSKGIGCPVGSVLVGPHALIAKARRIRKALGGGMRQAGVLAAAGLVGIADYQAGMLRRDHENARALVKLLATLSEYRVDVAAVESNIIMLHIVNPQVDINKLCTALKSHGVLTTPRSPTCMRLVLHRDVLSEDVPLIYNAFKESISLCV